MRLVSHLSSENRLCRILADYCLPASFLNTPAVSRSVLKVNEYPIETRFPGDFGGQARSKIQDGAAHPFSAKNSFTYPLRSGLDD